MVCQNPVDRQRQAAFSRQISWASSRGKPMRRRAGFPEPTVSRPAEPDRRVEAGQLEVTGSLSPSPACQKVLSFLAITLLWTGHPEEALSVAERVTRISPSYRERRENELAGRRRRHRDISRRRAANHGVLFHRQRRGIFQSRLGRSGSVATRASARVPGRTPAGPDRKRRYHSGLRRRNHRRSTRFS